MISMRFCGPKLSICCSILSVWGIIMLVFLGIFLQVRSAAFAEDLGIEAEEGRSEKDIINEATHSYIAASHNCLIAACLYVLSLCLSVWQYYINRRAISTT